MNHERFEVKLIQQQNLYIQNLEEQLEVCEEKIKTQELLIEKLEEALTLFGEELSKIKAEKEQPAGKEKETR